MFAKTLIYGATVILALGLARVEMRMREQMKDSLEWQQMPLGFAADALLDIPKIYAERFPDSPLPATHRRYAMLKFIPILALVLEVVVLQR